MGIVGHRWTWVIPNRLRESTYTKDKELLGDAYCDLNQIKTKLPDFHPPLLFGLSSFTSSIQFLLCFLVCPVSHPQLLLGAILARQAPSAKARFPSSSTFGLSSFTSSIAPGSDSRPPTLPYYYSNLIL